MKYEGQQLGKCISSKEMDFLLLCSRGYHGLMGSPLLCSFIFLKIGVTGWGIGDYVIWENVKA